MSSCPDNDNPISLFSTNGDDDDCDIAGARETLFLSEGLVLQVTLALAQRAQASDPSRGQLSFCL